MINVVHILEDGCVISNLFYVDDIVFVGYWHVLRVFHLASELKINVAKSKNFSVGVSSYKVEMVNHIDCKVVGFWDLFLRVPIGVNMKKAISWKPLFETFTKTLSSSKVKALSCDERSTLIKYVLWSVRTYWFFMFTMPSGVLIIESGYRYFV